MKKQLRSFTCTLLTSTAILGSTFLPAHAATLSSPSISTTHIMMKQYMQNTQVEQLQQDLKTLGFYSYPSCTGYFGSITKKAVESFQSNHGLQVDGIVGPVTEAAIQRALSSTNTSHTINMQKLLDDANKYIGTPYIIGGATPSGFDCSGFVYYMFNTEGYTSFPRLSSTEMYQIIGTPVDRSNLQAGDLVFFSLYTPGVVGHVGFYVGNDQFISATSHGVKIESMDNSWFGPRYIGARRVS